MCSIVVNTYLQRTGLSRLPKAILPMLKNFPQNRLGFAQWLVHPDHPLTQELLLTVIGSYFGKD
jgi:hypothetical protein